MNEPNDHSDFWEPCPAGELQRVVQSVKTRHRNRTLAKVGGAAAIVLVGTVIGSMAVNHFGAHEPNYGGIACRQVQSLLKQFDADQLDKVTAARMRIHLSKCAHCGHLYDSMQQNVTAKPVGGSDHAQVCDCAECQNGVVVALVSRVLNP